MQEDVSVSGKKEMEKQMKLVDNRIKRMAWWHEARFGMFVHWGLYSQTGRHEWVMNAERIPVPEYEKLAATWHPKPGAARKWAALAARAGMKYMVLTTKHHEGFCLWDSKLTDYCATKRGPGRDLVKEYVDACREYGLKVGFYYSLMDWHHPDGHACARDEKARRRFVDYTYGLVRELMSNYGKIDILWYDVSWPLKGADKWESARINAMARKLQPNILINDRSQLPEDFGTPEEHIVAQSSENGRGWEACMTFNGAWGFMDTPDEDWHGPRAVLAMLNQCTSGKGNLLLNIGPKADGSVPRQAIERLSAVGAWLKKNGEAVYGQVDSGDGMQRMPLCKPMRFWTRKGSTYYCWVARWPGSKMAIGGLRGTIKRISLIGGANDLPFTQEPDRLIIRGLPKQCPDKILGVAVLRLECEENGLQQFLGAGCEPIGELKPLEAEDHDERERSPFVPYWNFSLLEKPLADIKRARPVRSGKQAEWYPIKMDGSGFVNIHSRYVDIDGLVYLRTKVKVKKEGTWDILLGHDGPAKLFVDGKAVAAQNKVSNPCLPDRTEATVKLSRGTHDIAVAFDLAEGKGWGICLRFAVPVGMKKIAFPEPVKE